MPSIVEHWRSVEVDPHGWRKLPDEDGWRGDGEDPKRVWEEQRLRLEHFGPHEFDRPELMDAEFLLKLDYLRSCCDFSLKILDDARTEAENKVVYRNEIEAGQSYPSDSAHVLLSTGEEKVCAVDLRPWSHGELRMMVLVWMILEFQRRGIFDRVGMGNYNRHLHLDDQPRLKERRPAIWTGVSR